MKQPVFFSSIAELTQQETIAKLLNLQLKEFSFSREPIVANYSDAIIERIQLHMPDETIQSCILKQFDASSDWLMHVAGDTLCREVQFAQSPLWENVPETIVSPLLACAYDGKSKGALLMSDVRQWLFPIELWYTKPDFSLIARILDNFSAMHAKFWGDSTLSLIPWLMPSANSLFMYTPKYLRTLKKQNKYTEEMFVLWEQVWKLLDVADAIAIQQTLADPTHLLKAVEQAPLTLVHGDAHVANAGEQNGKLIFIDWAFVTAAPATFDSLWLAITWRGMDPDRVLAYHRNALMQCGVVDVQDDEVWQLLVDLGWVRAVFLGAYALAGDVVDRSYGVPQDQAMHNLLFWCYRAAEILRKRKW